MDSDCKSHVSVLLKLGKNLIIAHPNVEAITAIGMPDKELEKRICAYIQPAAEAKPQAEDILSYFKTAGTSLFQRPESIEFFNTIPLTDVGKANRKVLQEDIKRCLGMAENY